MQRGTESCWILASLAAIASFAIGCSDGALGTPDGSHSGVRSCAPGAFLGCTDVGLLRCELTGDGAHVEACDGECSEERRACIRADGAISDDAGADDAGAIDGAIGDDAGPPVDGGQDAGPRDAGPPCTTGTTRCSGTSIQTCTAGTWAVSSACAHGCSATGGVHCMSLGASSLPADICRGPFAGSWIVSSSTTRDGAACDRMVTQASGPPICVIVRDIMEINDDQVLTLEGPYAFAIVARALRMRRRSSIVATNGSFAGGVGEDPGDGSSGGGGGGHEGTGAGGGGSSPGGGGNEYGSIPAPLLPGANGGGSSGERGTAGGAVQLVGCATLDLDTDSRISVRGGDGRLHGGGGSGGSVVLEGAVVIFDSPTVIDLAGGSGGLMCPAGTCGDMGFGCGLGGTSPNGGDSLGGGGGGSCGRVFVGVPAGVAHDDGDLAVSLGDPVTYTIAYR